jgi:hypothetical protein
MCIVTTGVSVTGGKKCLWARFPGNNYRPTELMGDITSHCPGQERGGHARTWLSRGRLVICDLSEREYQSGLPCPAVMSAAWDDTHGGDVRTNHTQSPTTCEHTTEFESNCFYFSQSVLRKYFLPNGRNFTAQQKVCDVCVCALCVRVRVWVAAVSCIASSVRLLRGSLHHAQPVATCLAVRPRGSCVCSFRWLCVS